MLSSDRSFDNIYWQFCESPRKSLRAKDNIFEIHMLPSDPRVFETTGLYSGLLTHVGLFSVLLPCDKII